MRLRLATWNIHAGVGGDGRFDPGRVAGVLGEMEANVAALQVMLDCDGRRMQVVATHLGLRPGERRRQVRRLLDGFETGGAQIEVLLGDLNEWFLWGRPLRWLRRHFAPARHLRTYPARLPLLALDRIWVRPHTAVAGLRTHVSPLARIASDHLPLVAELSLPEC